jgi:hypothetical protein
MGPNQKRRVLDPTRGVCVRRRWMGIDYWNTIAREKQETKQGLFQNQIKLNKYRTVSLSN